MSYDPSNRWSFDSDPSISRASETSSKAFSSVSNVINGPQHDAQPFTSMTGSTSRPLASLTDFMKLMETSGVDGPFFQKRVHEGDKLGTGAQFEVYSHRAGVKTSSRVEQPYWDDTKKLWKRHYRDNSIDVAVKRTKFVIPVAEAVANETTGTLPTGLGSPKQLHDLQLEILALSHSALRNHRNIVKLLAWGLDFDPQPQGGTLRPISPILVVERARCSLKDLFLESVPKQRMPTAIRAKLCRDVCKGLVALHRSLIIHGDIKTDNALVFPSDQTEMGCIAKLSDFGLSISEEESKQRLPTFRDDNIGTRGWQAPELEAGVGVSPRDLAKCDYFSLGLLIWSVMTADGGCPLGSSDRARSAPSVLNLANLPESMRNALHKPLSVLLGVGPVARVVGLEETFKALENIGLEKKLDQQGIEWIRRHFEKPKRTSRETVRFCDDLDGYHQASMLLNLDEPTPPASTAAGRLHARFLGFQWDEQLEFFRHIPYSERMELKQSYLNGIWDIFNANRDTLSLRPGALIGNELSGHEILAMMFSGTGGLEDRLPLETYLERRAFCAMVSASKGYLPAQALVRHFAKLLPANIGIDPEWSWKALSNGLVIAWDLQHQDPERFESERQIFRKRGGYNTHYVHLPTTFKSPGLQKCGLVSDALGWMKREGNLGHHLAATGDFEALGIMLEGGQIPDIDCFDGRGETILMKACMAGSVECTQLVIRHGADPAKASKTNGTVPLHWLFCFGPETVREIAQYLAGENNICLEKICDKNIPAFFFPFQWPSGSPLQWAIVANNSAAINTLLELGSSFDGVRVFFPEVPPPPDYQVAGSTTSPPGNLEASVILRFHIYTGVQYSECADMQQYRCESLRSNPGYQRELNSLRRCGLSLAREFDRRSISAYGNRLNLAIATNNWDRALQLLHCGSDINQFCEAAHNPWHTTLCGAISLPSVRAADISKLLDHGASVRGNSNPSTKCRDVFPLTVAAFRHDIKIVKLLVEEHLADVNALEPNPDARRGTALQAAILGPGDPTQLVQYLLEKNADVNAKAGAHQTALNCAAHRGRADLVDQLLSANADINAEGGDNWTALQYAAGEGHYVVVEKLLLNGANINAKGGWLDYTPLLAALDPAAYSSNPKVAHLLLDSGADIKIEGKHSPLHAATKLGAKSIVKRLLDLGADPNTLRGKHLENAVGAGSVKMMRVLIERGLEITREEIDPKLLRRASRNARMTEFLQMLLSKLPPSSGSSLLKEHTSPQRGGSAEEMPARDSKPTVQPQTLEDSLKTLRGYIGERMPSTHGLLPAAESQQGDRRKPITAYETLMRDVAHKRRGREMGL